MTNPEVTVVTVGTTPQLIFAGCGRTHGGSALFGDGAVAAGVSTSWFQLNYADAKELAFEADAQLYAVTQSGSVNVRVVRWF